VRPGGESILRKRDLGGLLLTALVFFVLVGAGVAEGGGETSSTLAFGSVPVNTSATLSDTVTVDAGFTISTVASTGVTAPFSVSFDTCGDAAGIGPGTCTIQASFAPTATGSPSSPLTLQECPTAGTGNCANLPGVELEGMAITNAAASPATLDFGSIPVNTSATLPDTITVDAGYSVESAGGISGLNPPFGFQFGTCGVPENLINALRRQGTKNLTVASNNPGTDGYGIGVLIENQQVKKLIASFVGSNKFLERLALNNAIEMELNPQGTLAERMRAAGAGIPAFFTPTGYGTMVAEGKEVREFGGRPHILVPSLKGDFAFVKAWKGDRWGNLVYRKTARNFNPVMATAAEYVVAEVEEMVELGKLDPDSVHTPGIFVDAIFQGTNYVKPIEPGPKRKRGE